MKYMEKVGLRDFSGISLPDESLSTVFSLPPPVFHSDDGSSDKRETYFGQLKDLSIQIGKNIFYGGNQNE